MGDDEAARTAIFLHHGLGAIEAWKEIPARLCAENDVRAIVYDRWGYGCSTPRPRFEPRFMEAEVPVLMEIIEAGGAAPVDLVGHSDGATVALLAAAWHPGRVRSVVSIAAHTFVEPQTTTSIEALRSSQVRGAAPAWLGRLHAGRGNELLEAWADVWLGQVHAAWDVRSELSGIRCPVLALQGDGDEFGSDEQLVAIGDRVAQAEVWRVAGAGHSPHLDVDDEFVERVARFWAWDSLDITRTRTKD